MFLDYISISKINLNKLKNLIKGIVKGCNIANCKLVGGETAEMPGTYTRGKRYAVLLLVLLKKKNT